SFIVHHIGLSTLVRVLSACLGLVLERTSLRESLAAASTLCTRRVTLRLGVEWQRHFVRGKRRPLPWWRSSVVDFGRVTERDGGGARDSVSCGHLPLLAGIAIGGVVQDGDRKSLGVLWT